MSDDTPTDLTDDSIDDPSITDLARMGHRLGDTNAYMWQKTLRSLGSSVTPNLGDETERAIEMVAGSIYGEYGELGDGDVKDAELYVRLFLAVYDLTDMGDVDDLLSREAGARTVYEGRLLMLEDD